MDEATANPRAEITLNSLDPPIGPDEFEPVVRYDEESGCITCLNRNISSYRTDRITAYFSILWHPKKPKAVGVKIFLGSPEYIADFLDELHQQDLNSSRTIPLSSIFLLWQMAVDPPARQEDQYLATFYRIGKEAVGEAALAPEVWETLNASSAAAPV